MKTIPLGVQLYTVREECKKDFKKTVTLLAKLGYQGVEFAWEYGGMMPDQLASFLQELNLKCCGLHAPLDPLLDSQCEWYGYALAVKSPFVTVSCDGEVSNNWMETIDKLQAAGRVAKSIGLTLSYHNHNQEFERIDGKYALDLLYDQTDPELVKAEMDTYWIKKSGVDPVAYIRRYPDRAVQIHLKDMDATDGSFTEVGTGLMDISAIFAAAKDVASQWIIYEQDICKRPPLESAKLTIENLCRAKLI